MAEDCITIDGLEVYAHHGANPEENVLGQRFVVSLRLYVSLAAAGESDDVADTVHYGHVSKDVTAYLQNNTFKLIEKAAEGTAQMLLSKYEKIGRVWLRLEKPWAPIGLPLRCVAVEIERSR